MKSLSCARWVGLTTGVDVKKKVVFPFPNTRNNCPNYVFQKKKCVFQKKKWVWGKTKHVFQMKHCFFQGKNVFFSEKKQAFFRIKSWQMPLFIKKLFVNWWCWDGGRWRCRCLIGRVVSWWWCCWLVVLVVVVVVYVAEGVVVDIVVACWWWWGGC